MDLLHGGIPGLSSVSVSESGDRQVGCRGHGKSENDLVRYQGRL